MLVMRNQNSVNDDAEIVELSKFINFNVNFEIFEGIKTIKSSNLTEH